MVGRAAAPPVCAAPPPHAIAPCHRPRPIAPVCRNCARKRGAIAANWRSHLDGPTASSGVGLGRRTGTTNTCTERSRACRVTDPRCPAAPAPRRTARQPHAIAPRRRPAPIAPVCSDCARKRGAITANWRGSGCTARTAGSAGTAARIDDANSSGRAIAQARASGAERQLERAGRSASSSGRAERRLRRRGRAPSTSRPVPWRPSSAGRSACCPSWG